MGITAATDTSAPTSPMRTGFCERFAGDIAGLGESLNDMCEDRSEVASAVQDAHTGERYHEDEQRDNSEIGD